VARLVPCHGQALPATRAVAALRAGAVARLRRGAVWAAGFRRVKPLRWRSGAEPCGLTRPRAGVLRP
jgi:hypothetical protein